MTTEEALAELEIELPWTKKLSCPKHSDSDPSLHVYPGDKGWYCFSCLQGGDGWDLLSLYLDVPVGELMRDRGVVRGPRPRSRWEQLAEIEARAWTIRVKFHQELKALWAGDKRRFYTWLNEIEDRSHHIYGDEISAKYFPEDKAPYQMELIVNDLEQFYSDALHGQRILRDMVMA